MFSCGQSDLWALITGLGLRGGWPPLPASFLSTGWPELSFVCRLRPFLAPTAWVGPLPALLLVASLVLVPFGQNGVGAGQPLGNVVPGTQVQGAGSFCSCIAPWCQPASCRAKGLGAGAQRIPPPEELSCTPTASSHKTQSKKESGLR